MIPQRNPRSPRVLSVRPLVSADLESLRQPSARTRIAKIRDSHHIIARLIASGLSNAEVAAQVGYNSSRISLLRNDPSVIELIAKYRDLDSTSWLASRDVFHETATSNMIKAERMIADTLDDAIDSDERLPLRTLISLTADRADRFGYGKHTTQTNVNIDFAAKLEAARRRIDQAKLIEAAE